MNTIRKLKVFILDEDREYGNFLAGRISNSGMIEVHYFMRKEELLTNIVKDPDLVVLSVEETRLDELGILKTIKSVDSDIKVVLLTKKKDPVFNYHSIKDGSINVILKNRFVTQHLENLLKQIQKLEQFKARILGIPFWVN